MKPAPVKSARHIALDAAFPPVPLTRSAGRGLRVLRAIWRLIVGPY